MCRRLSCLLTKTIATLSLLQKSNSTTMLFRLARGRSCGVAGHVLAKNGKETYISAATHCSPLFCSVLYHPMFFDSIFVCHSRKKDVSFLDAVNLLYASRTNRCPPSYNFLFSADVHPALCSILVRLPLGV
jgi:hypothetical protein